MQAHLEALERARTSTNVAWRDLEAIGIRVSTELMLVFLMQILSAQHRYNSRLAAHYHAVSDAIVRMKETGLTSPQDFQILVQVFFPDASFGREPKTLPKEVVDLLTGLAKRN